MLLYSSPSLWAYSIRTGTFKKIVTLENPLQKISVAASIHEGRVFFSGGRLVNDGVFLQNWFGNLQVEIARDSR